MNISALVNPVPKEAALPRRSPSTHSISAPSPALSVAKLPTPPLSTHRNILPKRKRHDPKPLWAVREHELVDGETLQQSNLRQQSRPPAPTTPRPQSQPPTAAAPPRPPSAHQNGPPSGNPIAQPPLATRELQGYERPVSNDSQVYDDISRKVCDFIWNSAVGNPTVRNAIAESPHTQLEVEARWGQIIDRSTQSRLRGVHDTECVVRQGAADTKFESTMTMDQHKRMNMYLNTQVQKSKVPNSMRASVDYHHTREIDMFYELDQEAFNLLPPLVQHLIRQSPTRQRIRVTKDAQTNNILRKIIKHRIANFEISSPQTEWDYRIGVNLEIEFPGSIESLTLAVEQGKTPETMQRKKDRMSYAWLGAYQVDLTQVVQGQNKNHELELELNSQVLLDNADNIDKNVANCFEPLINGMMNNLRVLSREITPAGPN